MNLDEKQKKSDRRFMFIIGKGSLKSGLGGMMSVRHNLMLLNSVDNVDLKDLDVIISAYKNFKVEIQKKIEERTKK